MLQLFSFQFKQSITTDADSTCLISPLRVCQMDSSISLQELHNDNSGLFVSSSNDFYLYTGRNASFFPFQSLTFPQTRYCPSFGACSYLADMGYGCSTAVLRLSHIGASEFISVSTSGEKEGNIGAKKIWKPAVPGIEPEST